MDAGYEGNVVGVAFLDGKVGVVDLSRMWYSRAWWAMLG